MIGLFWILLCGVVALWGYLNYKSNLENKQEIEQEGVLVTDANTLSFLWNTITGKSFVETVTETYKAIKMKSPVKVGVDKVLGSTTYYVCDLDLTRRVFVKDFDHFGDRTSMSGGESDKYVQKMLMTLTGERWKGVRAKMSPTFTTGRIRRMFRAVNESGEKMCRFLEQELSSTKYKNVAYTDLERAYSKFTMDAVASVAFGVDAKAFETREKGIFEKMGEKLQFRMNFLGVIKMLLIEIAPKVGDYVDLSLFSREAQEFFAGMVKSVIAQREANGGERREDFLQLMMELRKEKIIEKNDEELETFEKEAQIKLKDEEMRKVTLDEDDIIGQSILFILGGYDTTLAGHLFCAYTLATHPAVQEKLYEEIEQVLKETGGTLSYDEVMNGMPYLDMVFNETMRLYPPGTTADRVCTRDYVIPGTSHTIKKGSTVVIPIFSIHRDPEMFENPDSFDPERWNKERRGSISNCYMGFGHGPRNCIGMRFAIMEIKLAVVHLVKSFKLEPSAETPIPMKFSNTIVLTPSSRLKLKLTSRK